MAIKYENFAFTLEGLSYIQQQINFTKKTITILLEYR